MSDPITATAAVWLWDQYGKKMLEHLAKTLGKDAMAQWETFHWQDAAEKYRQRMAANYGTVRVLGSPGPTPLEGIFTEKCFLKICRHENRKMG